MAQPKKPEDELRSHVVKLSLSDAEMEQLKAKAGREPLAKYCREAVLNRPGQAQRIQRQQAPEINREKWMELGRVGANLNQIARHLNGGELVESDQILSIVTAAKQELEKLRREVWPG